MRAFRYSGANEDLYKESTQGHKNLAQWIVGLSTGSILFAVNFLQDISGNWRYLLLFAVFLLFVSMLTGIGYIKVCLNYATYNLSFNQIKQHSGENSEEAKKSEKKMDDAQKWMLPLIKVNIYGFYVGIIIMALFWFLSMF